MTCFITICIYISQTVSLRLSSPALTFNTKKDKLIVFQYGKVGSSTLEVQLGNLMRSPGRLPYISHFQKDYPQGAKIHDGSVVKSMLEHTNEHSTTWVVTVSRNRFYRDISAYFQNVEKWFSRERVLSMPISQLHDDFRHRFHENPSHDNPHRWFQTEFKQTIGVNLTDYADGFENGSLYLEHTWNGRSIRIVFVRFEDISHWQGTLGIYFPGFKMGPAVNVGGQKWYKSRYAEFLNTYKFSKAEIELLCGGDTMKFYSEEEKLAMAPQCSAASFAPPKLMQDSGHMYVLTAKSKLLLEGFNEDSIAGISAEDGMSI